MTTALMAESLGSSVLLRSLVGSYDDPGQPQHLLHALALRSLVGSYDDLAIPLLARRLVLRCDPS